MKTLNTIFAGVYSVILVATVYFGINWSVTRGISSMFDNATEFVFALLYIVALLISIFMHIKLRNNTSVENKIFVVMTSINMIILIGLVLSTLNASSDDGLLLAVWMFAVLVSWLGSLVSGVIALKGSNT